ncbi:saccharopine dehydrogenase NADP-binding domain-containing protein [Gammaproteobacteria bacterium]|nr:saccharopine dehydrogenase NADP-binding domain-containing protein [Gammaproteobacteria bacterium]MDA9249104.1 saccharopine dehydrogenase NADP-binding domain-containing protein [Gammaproteobacteria bacterium]MDB4194398.1 saccharopine dehydrogenase NADP-binding domain-containing protein [Gammaproteobacteria bacterium]MDB4843708.1 saccharopine dehydrogenase NADP-binding domain-containing protein [Gammaproteobacteria bacterium]MDB9909520.1 saccharopine dehydrogenase NADP-binding domain-containin
MQKDIDIIIYGATGFTGQLCVKYFQSLNTGVKWAIAGRDQEKLQKVALDNSADVEILIADSDDEAALDILTSRATVILSTTGPFHRYGSKLVASCVKNSANYVDITGENFWVKGLIAKHHEEASEKGIRIIPSCGYDSIPSDLGVFYSAKALNKPIKRIESFHSWEGGASGGTLETMFSMGDLDLGDDLLDPYLLNPKDSYTQEQKEQSSDRVGIAKKNEINAWSGPFIMATANTRVVRRTEALLSLRQESYGSNFTYQEHALHKTWFSAFKSIIVTGISVLVLMSPLKRAVKPFLPKPGEGPSEAVQENGWFDCKYIVETEDGEKSVFNMNAKGDPGYKVTAKLISECALCLIEDADDLPGGSEYGGVLTSASGLGNPLISRLTKVGVNFKGPL